MKQILFKTSLFVFALLAFFNCEKDETPKTSHSTISTVDTNESIAFLNNYTKNTSFSKISNSEQFVFPGLERISQETLTNTNELITVLPGHTKYNIYSRILILRINGNIQTVLFSMFREQTSENDNFSGKIYINDLEGNYINAFRVVDNVIVSRFLKPDAKSAQNATSKDGEDDCWGIACGMEGEEVLIIANKNNDINYTPLELIFRGYGNSSSYSWDPWPGAGGGNTGCSDGYVKDSNGNCVLDNFIEGCPEGYHKDDLGNCIINPIFSADCRSFEYAQPPGALLKACGVTGFWNTFYAYGTQNGKRGTFQALVVYPLVYFTVPPKFSNGYAANKTAEAVTKAMRSTELWFVQNPQASKERVGAKFSENILKEMRKFGGNMTQIPPFKIPSPAPFLSSLTGTGNCI